MSRRRSADPQSRGRSQRRSRPAQQPSSPETAGSGARISRRSVLGGALGLIMAGSGAAAGVTFEGDVLGEAVSQVDSAVSVSDVISFAFSNSFGEVSDDGTTFRSGAEIGQGDAYVIQLSVDNNSDQSRTEKLVLDVPEPLEVEVDADSTTGVEAARDQAGQWLLGLDDSSGQVIEITVAAPNEIEPGFYEITGKVGAARFN